MKYYFQKVFRLWTNPSKRKGIVWEDLKKAYIKLDWEHAVYEDKKGIESHVHITDEHTAIFIYQFEDNYLLYRSLFFFDYPEELVTDLFVLATHINNVLKFGMVRINLKDKCVEFTFKEDVVKSFLYPEDIEFNIVQQLRVLNETIFPSFYRLIYEDEKPAIIIADLMRAVKKTVGKESI